MPIDEEVKFEDFTMFSKLKETDHILTKKMRFGVSEYPWGGIREKDKGIMKKMALVGLNSWWWFYKKLPGVVGISGKPAGIAPWIENSTLFIEIHVDVILRGYHFRAQQRHATLVQRIENWVMAKAWDLHCYCERGKHGKAA